MIYGENVTLKIKNKKILDNVNFEVDKNKITCFLGNNGSGKTSLLRCILNLQKKYSGTILYENKNIKRMSNSSRAKEISFVFQEFNLFNNLTILQNCILPIINLFGYSNEEAEEIVLPILQNLNITNIKDMYPNKLSFGQRQKAAIARALSLKPKIIILDEPTSSLDLESTQNLAILLQNLKNQGITIVLTSHDKLFTDLIYDRIYELENGRIVKFYEKN